MAQLANYHHTAVSAEQLQQCHKVITSGQLKRNLRLLSPLQIMADEGDNILRKNVARVILCVALGLLTLSVYIAMTGPRKEAEYQFFITFTLAICVAFMFGLFFTI